MYDWQVFSTLSFSGSPLFSKYNRGFDVVIIDEAAQAVSCAILYSFFLFFVLNFNFIAILQFLVCNNSLTYI